MVSHFPCYSIWYRLDIGHGPFSHAFEGWLRHSHLGVDFHHEKMSQQMVEYLVDDNNIDMEKEEIRFIQDLIAGTSSKYFPLYSQVTLSIGQERNSSSLI